MKISPDLIPSFFYNFTQHRLRAFWRLLVQGVLYFGGVIGTGIAIGIAAVILYSLSGTPLTANDLMQVVSGSVWVKVLSALVSLLIIFLTYWIGSRWLDHRPWQAYGFHFSRNWWADFGFGLFLGALLMGLAFLVELSAGWVTITGFFQGQQPGESFLGGMLAALVIFICVGIYEEMLSRGYQLRNLAEGLNFKPLNPRLALLLAYLGSSIFFGLLHSGNPNATLLSSLYLIGAGLLLGFGYILTGELALPIGLHIGWNFFQGNVFGFPVSGLGSQASIIAIQQGGPAVWTGGPFGPEGGLMHPLAVVVGCLLIAAWVRWHYGKAHLQARLAVYTVPDRAQPAAHQPGAEAAVKAS